MIPKSNVIPLSVHQYPTTNRLALRTGLLAFNGDDYRLVDDYIRLLGSHSVFRGSRVLVNCHLTSMTLLLLDALLAMGVQVYFASTAPLVIHDAAMGEYDALTPLKNAGIPHILGDASLSAWRSLSWDIMIDCGGWLYRSVQAGQLRAPTKGIIECARASYPHAMTLPVIDIDSADMAVKAGEEAGQNFIRALAHAWVQERVLGIALESSHARRCGLALGDMTFRSVFQQRFVIVGLGKLGRGLAKALLQAGLPPQKLLLIDKHRGMVQQAKQAFPLSDAVLLYPGEQSTAFLTERLSGTFCVITCTGSPQVMASWPMSVFDDVAYVCNMGTSNEWPTDMPASRFLAGVTHPLNFILATPMSPAMFSLMTYTLLRSAEYALDRRIPLPVGVLPMPPLLEKQIAHRWSVHRAQYALSNRVDYLDQIDQAVEEVVSTLSSSPDATVTRQQLLEQFGCY